jgi:EAL domain-containing protein (putative c-di-GMP-specific phosphodiesterase class I)
VDTRQSAGDIGVKGRVLVADDEIQILRAYSRVLEHAGYEVTVASTGGEANKLVEDDRFDVLFADIAMPEMTGLELLRRAHRVTPSLPVVLVTGSPAVETAMEAIEYSVYRYLVKPVDPTELVAIAEKATLLHRMLELRRDTRDIEDLAALSSSFESALARIWMAFQPIVRPDGTVFGYEALLRSDEPALPHPGAMLDAAERLGRLHDLGRVVRQRATSAFSKADLSTSLFVNVHTRDLLDDWLLSPTSPLVAIAPRVVLEITERASLSDVKDLRARLNTLRDLGFRIAIDDLGAGYAALTSFPLLEPDIVKIDMSLVRDIDSQPMKRKLVKSMTSLCREMKIEVVGEGVETNEEREVLVDLGCDLLQGYLIARPAHPAW